MAGIHHVTCGTWAIRCLPAQGDKELTGVTWVFVDALQGLPKFGVFISGLKPY